MTASGLPRCPSEAFHESVAHGVVPCARSPKTVAEPVEQRRPTARSCIGERSCASSRTTWPRLRVRWRWSLISSTSTVSATDHLADPRPDAGLAHRSIERSASVSRSALCLCSVVASESRLNSTAFGSSAGHTDAAYLLTAAERATASCTRSSGESPACSIWSRIAWARRCGSIRRAASYLTPRVRSSCTISATSDTGTRHL